MTDTKTPPASYRKERRQRYVEKMLQLAPEKYRERRRQAQKRYYERHLEKVRERAKKARASRSEEQIARAREAAARWCAANPEKAAESKRRYRERNREKHREWNRQAYIRRSKANPKRRKAARPAVDSAEIRTKSLLRDDIFQAAAKAVPSRIEGWRREDIIQDIVLAVLEGDLAIEDIPGQAQSFVRRFNRQFDQHLNVEFKDWMVGNMGEFQ